MLLDARLAGWVGIRHPKPLLLLIPLNSQHLASAFQKCNFLALYIVILYES